MNTKLLKQKILDLAIRGKLVPQDPNDEPASELLKRIHAEKEKLIAEGKIKRSKKTMDKPHYENVPFEVPNSWEWVKLKDIAIVINGKSQSDVVDPNGIYPIYGSGGIMGYANDYLCPEHCTIIGRKGTINNPILVETKFWNVDTAFGMSPNKSIDYHYFHFFCESFDFTSLDKSTTLPSLTKTNIELIDIPLPPRQEQSRIVFEIQKLLAFINQIEDDKYDLQVVIKQTKNRILDLAIHGKLVPQDSNDEPAIELLKRINPAIKPCDTSHYGNLPKGWCIVPLKETGVQILNGFAFKSTNYVNRGIKVIRITNVQDGYVCDDDPKYYPLSNQEELDKYMLYENDLLMSLTGNVGRVGFLPKEMLPAALNQRVGCLRGGDDIIDKNYLCYYLQCDTFKRDCLDSAKGVAQLNISTEWLKAYPILLPPINEQKRIAKQINTLFSRLDEISADL